MTQLEIALQIEVQKLQDQTAQIKRIATTEGFFKTYFENCKTAKSNVEAFEKTNNLYFYFFEKYRYTDYGSFKNVMNYYHKKNKK